MGETLVNGLAKTEAAIEVQSIHPMKKSKQTAPVSVVLRKRPLLFTAKLLPMY